MSRFPSYLRVVCCTPCPLKCTYCHAEGSTAEQPNQLSRSILSKCLAAVARVGVQKFKLLGGEPLIRKDLPGVIRDLKEAAPDTDVSVITSGVARTKAVDDAFEAGLDRMNLTIHGWGTRELAKRKGNVRMHAMRRANLDRLVELGRSIKVNYVYTGSGCEDDLAGLLEWAADKDVVVGVLDNLEDEDASPLTVIEAFAAHRRQVGPDGSG